MVKKIKRNRMLVLLTFMVLFILTIGLGNQPVLAF